MRNAPLLILSFLVFASCSERGGKTTTAETPAEAPPDTSRRVTQQSNGNPYAGIDISPMDMSYFPVDYPKLKISNQVTEGPKARIIYSRPHLGGRKLFPDILKYGSPWRLGANESTELQLFTNASIQGKNIPAGRYILYCIPQPGKWTFVLNTFVDSWGLKQDQNKNVATFTVDLTSSQHHVEYFTIIFQQKGMNAADLLFAWENTEARLPFSF